MSFTLALKIFIWETGWFWGKQNRRFKILKLEVGALGLGLNLDISVL
jgi:hypothetical protein